MSCVIDALASSILAMTGRRVGRMALCEELRAAKRDALASVRVDGARVDGERVQKQLSFVACSSLLSGYNMSHGDPLLVSLCALYRCRIDLDFAGQCVVFSVDGATRRLRFRSSRTHFSFIGAS